MHLDQDLDPTDLRLLTAILDALRLKGQHDASVVEDFGISLADGVDYAAVARWTCGAWVAEVRLVHEAPKRYRFDPLFADLDDLPDPRI